MERKYFYTVCAAVILALVGVNAYFLMIRNPETNFYVTVNGSNRLITQTTSEQKTAQRFVDVKCSSNSDCSWEITNCCTENAGGKWECINGKTFVSGCAENILCPQVVSPKPTATCACNNGSCTKQ